MSLHSASEDDVLIAIAVEVAERKSASGRCSQKCLRFRKRAVAITQKDFDSSADLHKVEFVIAIQVCH